MYDVDFENTDDELFIKIFYHTGFISQLRKALKSYDPGLLELLKYGKRPSKHQLIYLYSVHHIHTKCNFLKVQKHCTCIQIRKLSMCVYVCVEKRFLFSIQFSSITYLLLLLK